MVAYAIMQEPGEQAHRRRARLRKQGYDGVGSPRMKRAATVVQVGDEGQKSALGEFIYRRYLARFNKQYAGHRFEFLDGRARTWKPDDGADPGTRGRDWAVVVTLANGAYAHDTRFLAWKEADR